MEEKLVDPSTFASGTFETYRPPLTKSVNRDIPEVAVDGENDAIDPNVWSGRALQVVSPSWR
jgi:hypothetical protein